MKRLLILLSLLAMPTLALAQHEDPSHDDHAPAAAQVAPVDVAPEAHADDQAAHDDHSEEPTVFAGTIIQSISAVIVFLLLLGVLWKFAWGPILTGLQDRETKIRDDLDRAERATAQAEATLAEYRKQLDEASAEAKRIIEQGRAESERLGAQLRQQAEGDAARIRERSQADIRAAKEQALSEIFAQAATLSTDVAGRILGREIRPEDQKALVEQSLDQLKSGNGAA